MRSLILFLIALTAQAADFDLATVTITDVSHSSASVCWTTSDASTTTRKLAYDTTAKFGVGGTFDYRSTASIAQTLERCWPMSALAPATDYTVCVEVAKANGDTTNCSSVANRATFTTAAEPSPHPAVAILPDVSGFDTVAPTVFAETLEANTCAEIFSHYTTARGAGYSGLNVKIRVLYTLDCSQRMLMSTKPGGGYIVFETSAANMLPPEGVRAGPLHLQWMPKFRTIGQGTAGTSIASNAAGDASLRFIGIGFTTVLTGDLGQDYTIRSFGMHRIIFDRCFFYDYRSPGRTVRMVYWDGNYLAILDSYFDNIEFWKPAGSSPFTGSFGGVTVEGSNAVVWGGGQYGKFHNNYVNATGISFFYQRSSALMGVRDQEVTMNEFVSDVPYATDSSMLVYARRHAWEAKLGERIRIEGNRFGDGFASLTGTCAMVAFKADETSIALDAYLRDITFRRNWIDNGPCGIYLSSKSSTTFLSVPKRITLEGNLITNISGQLAPYTVVATDSMRRGIAFWNPGGAQEDVILRQNTFANIRGNGPAMFRLEDDHGEGWLIENNIFNHQSGSVRLGGLKGIMEMPPDVTNSTPAISTTDSALVDGVEVLDAYLLRKGTTIATSYTWRNNLVLVGCVDSYAGCAESATGAALDTADKSALYPATTYFSAGATYADRANAVTWQGRASGNLRLRYNSAYNVAGASRGYGGVAMGADLDAIDAARGITKAVSVLPSTTSIVIKLLAPDTTRACWYGSRLSGSGAAYTYVADTPGGSRFRSVTISDLTTKTSYDLLIGCYTQVAYSTRTK